MNRCNISFAISRVEDCLELNFKYVDYQTLAHLSYSSCVYLTSVRTARAQRFLSVRVSVSDSTFINSGERDNLLTTQFPCSEVASIISDCVLISSSK